MNIDYWNKKLKETSQYAIQKLNSKKLPLKPAIIFDIDNTLIDEKNYLLQPISCIYHYAQMLNIQVFTITERFAEEIIIFNTISLMKSYGLQNSFYYFRKYSSKNIWSFKFNSRKDIVKRGYNIIMSVGDSNWDICGKYVGIPIRVPKKKLENTQKKNMNKRKNFNFNSSGISSYFSSASLQPVFEEHSSSQQSEVNENATFSYYDISLLPLR